MGDAGARSWGSSGAAGSRPVNAHMPQPARESLSRPMQALRDLKWWFDEITTLRQLEGQISNRKSEI